MVNNSLASLLLFTVVLGYGVNLSKITSNFTEAGTRRSDRPKQITANLNGSSTLCEFLSNRFQLVLIKPYPKVEGQLPLAVAFVKDYFSNIKILVEKEEDFLCQSISDLSDEDPPSWISSNISSVINFQLRAHCFSKEVYTSLSPQSFPFKLLYKISQSGSGFIHTLVAYLIPNKETYLIYSSEAELQNICTHKFYESTTRALGARKILKGENLSDLLKQVKKKQ